MCIAHLIMKLCVVSIKGVRVLSGLTVSEDRSCLSIIILCFPCQSYSVTS